MNVKLTHKLLQTWGWKVSGSLGCALLLVFAFSRLALATNHYVPSGSISPSVWDSVDQQWENGNPSGYSEGDTAAMAARITNQAGETYLVDICLQVYETTNPPVYTFTELDPWNQTYQPPKLPGATGPTVNYADGHWDLNDPNVWGYDIDILSVTAATLSNAGCNDNYVGVTVEFQVLSNNAYLVWGGHVAAPGDPLPAGTVDATVPADRGAAAANGVFQVRLAGGGDKTINFKPGDIQSAPGVVVSKSVSLTPTCPGSAEVTVPEGTTVYYCFVVLNNGTADLLNVTLTDSLLPAPNDVLTDQLTGLTNEDGDNTADDLAPNASAYAGPIAYTVGNQDVTNTATAAGTGVAPSTDTGTANVYVVDVEVDKKISTDGTNFVDGPTQVAADANIWWQIKVVNNSTVAVDLTLTDTLDGQALNLSACAEQPVPTSLTANGGAYTCTIGPVAAVAGSHTNTISAQGCYTDPNFGPVCDPDSDATDYFGVKVDVEATKQVSTDGVTFGDGPVDVAVGTNIWWQIKVVNNSNVAVDLSLTDTLDGQPFNLSACAEQPVPTSLTASGGSYTCTIGPVAALAGSHTNTIKAEGCYTLPGTTTKVCESDTDDSGYFGVKVDVEATKQVSTDGTNFVDGPVEVAADANIWWQIQVVNNSNVAVDLSLTDTFDGQALDLSACVPSAPPATLAANGGAYTCTLGPVAALAGSRTNTIDAEGCYTLPGTTTKVCESDTDDSGYFGVKVDVEATKQVSTDGVAFVNGPVDVTAGANIWWQIKVVNNSNVAVDLSLTDTFDGQALDLSACAPSAPPATLAANGGAYTCTLGPVAALAGSHTNKIDAEGCYTLPGTTTKVCDPDTDDSGYFGVVPGITIDKQVSRDGTTWSISLSGVFVGTDLYYRFILANTGNVALDSVVVTDPILAAALGLPANTNFCASVAPLAVNSGSVICGPIGPVDAQYTGGGALFINTALAEGCYTSAPGGAFCDEDDGTANYSSQYWGFTPGFWKNHSSSKLGTKFAWQYSNYTTSTTLAQAGFVLPSCTGISGSDTLLKAVGYRGGTTLKGASEILLRAAVSSLLNASFHEKYHNAVYLPGVGLVDQAPNYTIIYWPYSSQQIIDMVNAALATCNRSTILALAAQLDAYNNGIHQTPWPGQLTAAAVADLNAEITSLPAENQALALRLFIAVVKR